MKVFLAERKCEIYFPLKKKGNPYASFENFHPDCSRTWLEFFCCGKLHMGKCPL